MVYMKTFYRKKNFSSVDTEKCTNCFKSCLVPFSFINLRSIFQWHPSNCHQVAICTAELVMARNWNGLS